MTIISVYHTSHQKAFLNACPHRTFLIFSATACWVDKIFNIGATIRVECFNHNYDVIVHVVWQPCWKNGEKKLWISISETAPRKKLKLGTRQVLLMGNKCDFLMTSSVPSL